MTLTVVRTTIKSLRPPLPMRISFLDTRRCRCHSLPPRHRTTSSSCQIRPAHDAQPAIAGVTEWTDTSNVKLPLQMSAYSQTAKGNPKSWPTQADYTLVWLLENQIVVLIPSS